MSRYSLRSVLPGILLAGIVVAINTTAWSDKDRVEEIKKEVGFSKWPGKGLPLTGGFQFDAADYPELSGYEVEGGGYATSYLTYGLVRHFRLRKGDDAMEVVVGVGDGSNEAAQEMLIQHGLLWITGGLGSLVSPKEFGGELGDVAFVNSDATVDDFKNCIRFVRRNIYVVLKVDARDHSRDALLTALAKAIDAKILAMPDLTPAGFEALRPTFSKADLSTDTIVPGEGPGSSATLEVATTDPRGEDVRILVESDGKLDIEEQADGTFLIRGKHYFGPLSFMLVAVNESLIGSKKTVTINVKEP